MLSGKLQTLGNVKMGQDFVGRLSELAQIRSYFFEKARASLDHGKLSFISYSRVLCESASGKGYQKRNHSSAYGNKNLWGCALLV